MSAVLVTGSTGNVGAAVVAALAARDVDVRAAVRPGRDDAAAGTVALDFDDPATFDAALEGVRAVFLMRPPHFSESKRMRPFISAIAQSGVEHVVFLSVQGAGTNPFVPHHGIERDLKRCGIAWTILRPSFFMSNLSTTHRADIAERGEIVVPAGRGRTNFIDPADIAEAAALILTEPGHERRAYELTGSEALTYYQVAEELTRACGRQITYTRPSARRFKAHMRAAGCDDDYISVMANIYLLAKLGMAAGTTDELERLIGRPPTTFAQWAAQNAECFRAPDA